MEEKGEGSGGMVIVPVENTPTMRTNSVFEQPG